MVADLLNPNWLGPLSPLLEGGDLPYRLFMSRSGSTWLLPDSSKRVRGALLVFPPRSPLLRLAWEAWRRGLPVGLGMGLNAQYLDKLVAALAPHLRTEGVVIHIGTPGAYRKAVLGLWAGGAAQAIIKLALAPAADPWVVWEAHVLSRLMDWGEGLIPKLLYTGQHAGRAFHATAPVMGHPAPKRLTRQHLTYSARLFRQESSQYPWSESPLRAEWLEQIARRGLVEQLPTLEQAVIWLEKRLAQKMLSFGWAHGDFVPWNTRCVDGRLLVLDWEMARPNRPPGYDILHFESMQAALRGRPPKISWKTLRAWLEVNAPEWVGLEQELYVTYLVDQAIYYLKAKLEAPEVGEEVVLNWLLKEIQLAVED